ncbi:hypothetical protein HPB48_013458 [Haemaphysalis longicornis]|uniref:Uncharacterized protein n=1 Tax=Haemaphysalis longicornis TaxID=44386 RepID=A0A9J6FYX9_HAELO|nr:hypothetical protein HPB48_013458 [Haemaphysalis longicornis]
MAKYAGRFDLEPADKKNVLPLSMHHLASGWASIGGQLSIVAAVMSSVDSSMFSASSLVAHNIYYCVARRKASEGERAIVLRCAVLLLGAVATVIALATNSVFALWTQSSELCYVLLFPQFIALFFLQRYSNAYGAVLGFLIGITARVLCGAPDVGIPVLIRLPLYDSEHGQQFPFRTLCMLISLVAILVTSILTGYVFDTGLLPPDWDVWNCLGYAKFYADNRGAKTVPAESSTKIVTNVGTRPSAALTPRDGFTPDTPVIPLDKTKRGVPSGNITAKTSAINTRTSTAENAATPTKRLSLSPSTDTKRRKNIGDLPSSAEPTTVPTGPTNTVPSPKQLGTGKSSNTANRSVGVSGIGTEPSAASAVPTGRSSSSFRAVTASERIPITEKPGEEEDKASAPLEQSTAISWFRNKRKPAKTRNVGDLATGNTSTGPATPSGRMSAQGTTATGAGKTAPATPLSIPGTTEVAKGARYNECIYRKNQVEDRLLKMRESSEEEVAEPASCAMSLALRGALSVIGYFTVNIGVGLWAAGRRIQPRTPLVEEPVPDYLLRLLLANRALPLCLGFISMTGETVSIIADLNPALAIVASGSTMLLYTSVGGLISVVYTDVLQALTTLVGLWACVPAIASSSATDRIRLPRYSWLGKIELKDLGQLLDLQLMTTLGGIPWQLAIVAAVMSSVDSSMLSASSLVAHNIYYCVARPEASEGERAIVLRCAVLLLGAVATVIALATNSVFALWTQSSELCYVLLFPQFIALFFLQRYSNAYGAVLGFLIGITARVLCGAPDIGIPVLIRLPLYDSERGQQFPFRTLCMVISLVAIPVTSILTGYVFDTGLLPPDWDVWNCLGYDTFYADNRGAKTVPAESSRKIVTNVGTKPSAALTPRGGFTPETPGIPLEKTKRGVASGSITAKTSAINTRTSTPENAATPTKRVSLSPSTDTKRRKKIADLPSSAEATTIRTGPTNTVPSPKQLGTGKSSNTADRGVGVSGIGTELSATSAVPTGRSSSSFPAVTASERIPVAEKPGEEEDKASAPLENSTAITWFRYKRKTAKTRNTSGLATGTTSTGPVTPSGRMSAQGTTATAAGKTAPATPRSIPGTTEGAGKGKAKETATPKST